MWYIQFYDGDKELVFFFSQEEAEECLQQTGRSGQVGYSVCVKEVL